MGSKHPLDLFRSSDSGFNSASRGRRTVQGRVTATAPRAKPQASAKQGAGKQPARAGAAPRKVLYGVLALVGLLSIYLVGANSRGDSPALKSGSPSAADGTALFAVQVLDVVGSESSLAIARDLRDKLNAAGYPQAQVLGYAPIKNDLHARYAVTVGLATEAEELTALLDAMQRLPGPGADPELFRRSKLVEIPR
ncbi:MAG: hypothetical protein ACT4PU_11355 [Planctomycetota bacterium]